MIYLMKVVVEVDSCRKWNRVDLPKQTKYMEPAFEGLSVRDTSDNIFHNCR